MPERCSVRIVVLDGFDWRWAESRRDQIPEVWGLAEDGCCAPLRCGVPVTPSGVAALLTGRDVDLEWGGGDGPLGDRYASSQDLIRQRPWAAELERAGLTLGLVNVPLTWPAFRLPGVLYCVSGFPVGGSALSGGGSHPWHRPAGLDVLGYPIEDVVCDSGSGPGGTRDLASIARAESEICDWVIGSAPRADVEVVWLRSTDSAGHHAWGGGAYDLAARGASRLVGRLREEAENVVLISDHGMDSIGSERCSEYLATNHGPSAVSAGLVGGHTREGVIFAAGPGIRARGILPEQRLHEVAGGVFDLLQVPPAPGMVSAGPAWSAPYGADDASAIRDRLRALGYVT